MAEIIEQLKKFNVHIKIVSSNITSWKNSDAPYPIKKRAATFTHMEKLPVVTEWKRPDFMATPMYITEGYQHNVSRSDCGELGVDIKTVEWMDGEGPITNIHSPYHLKSTS